MCDVGPWLLDVAHTAYTSIHARTYIPTPRVSPDRREERLEDLLHQLLVQVQHQQVELDLRVRARVREGKTWVREAGCVQDVRTYPPSCCKGGTLAMCGGTPT